MSQRLIALVVTALALATLPYWMGGIYYINVASQILFYAIFALGLKTFGSSCFPQGKLVLMHRLSAAQKG